MAAKLTPKQEKALVALLSEPTIKAAAASIGIGESTLHLWLQDPIFDDAYREARRGTVQQAITRLQSLSGAAVVVLAHLMADKNTPASTRYAAASKILDTAIKAVELEQLEARLAALEAAFAQSEGGKD